MAKFAMSENKRMYIDRRTRVRRSLRYFQLQMNKIVFTAFLKHKAGQETKKTYLNLSI